MGPVRKTSSLITYASTHDLRVASVTWGALENTRRAELDLSQARFVVVA